MIRWFERQYGAHPMQLVVMLAASGLAGSAALHWAGNAEWLRILIWFGAAIVAHDVVLFPLYAAADGLLVRAVSRWGLVNYLRIPLLACALTFVLFLPGIISQGAASYHAATGLTQQPFVGRWLALCTAFFVVSAAVFWLRALIRHDRGRRHRASSRPSPPPRRPSPPDQPTNPAAKTTPAPQPPVIQDSHVVSRLSGPGDSADSDSADSDSVDSDSVDSDSADTAV